MGFYSPSSIIIDAQRHGVLVRPPCVVRSDWDSIVERGPNPRTVALRLGLRQIRGLGKGVASAIVAARSTAPLVSLTDLIRRARLPKNAIEALAESGALDAISPSRREALWRARAPRVEGLFEGLDLEPAVRVGLPPLRPLEQLELDYGRLGLSTSDHPMRYLRRELALRNVQQAAQIKEGKNGARVLVAGLVIGRQRPATASAVTFITLEDETGMTNLIVKEATFARYFAVAKHAQLLLASGRVERQGDVVHVLVHALERLSLPDGETLPAQSRDFH
jgi:error-prone DNA polymerase